MFYHRPVVVAATALVLAVSTLNHAQSPAPPAAKVDFATEIQPLLRQHCISCHGPKKQENGLRLDRRKDAMRGGTIAVIGPGNADGSRLYHRLIGDNFGIQMPPTGALTPEKIPRIKAWIDQGAEWPDAFAGDRPPTVPNAAVVRLMDLLRGGDRAAFTAGVAVDPSLLNGPGLGGATPVMFAALYR